MEKWADSSDIKAKANERSRKSRAIDFYPGGECLQVFEKTGAGNRIRTYDLLITNQLLYQLSYAGLMSILF